MYISDNEPISIDIERLSSTTNDDISWGYGYQDENVLKIKFEIDPKIETFILKDPLQQLCSDIKEHTEFLLTGIKYNISENTGEFIFSTLSDIDTAAGVSKQLSRNPSSITVPRTVAYNNIVTCTGAFVAFFDWDYNIEQVKFDLHNGVFLTARTNMIDKKATSQCD